jgi:homoserine kinase
VAGVFGVNAYLGFPLEKKDLLSFATEGEQIADGSYHADNVAPSLLGGIILLRDTASLDFIKLPAPPGLKAIVIHPHIEVLTRESRAILSNDISLQDHILQSGNLAGFVAALYKLDLALLGRSLNDNIIEPQRAKLIPYFYDIKEIALNQSVLGFSISGAGPSMFGLCANSVVAENSIEKIKAFLFSKGIEADYYISNINQDGAKIY